MYLPHQVTVYNVREDKETSNLNVNITVLPRVFLDNKDGEAEGLPSNSGASYARLYVPIEDTGAYDAIDKTPKQYVSPRIYDALLSKDAYWTLDTSGGTMFVLGETDDVGTMEEINERHDYAYVARNVEVNNYGSLSLRHIKVEGR